MKEQIYKQSESNYTRGLVYSLILVMVSFGLTKLYAGHNESGFPWLVIVSLLTASAFVQLFVQLRYFLHVGEGSSTRWKKAFFALMALFFVVVVVGSLWIMQNLDYNMGHRSGNDIDSTIINDELGEMKSMDHMGHGTAHGSSR